VFHEEIQPVEPVAEETPILVSQNFFRHSDRYRFENNERLDKFVTDEFLIHVVYGCQVVVTNPTSSAQKLDVLLQVPLGAIPVLNGRYTRSVHTQLQPFSTQTLEYHFYFPAPASSRTIRSRWPRTSGCWPTPKPSPSTWSPNRRGWIPSRGITSRSSAPRTR
jgi:hypothetical protein